MNSLYLNIYNNMKHTCCLVLAACLLMSCCFVQGQNVRAPKLAVTPSADVPPALSRVTNYNPSVSLADSTWAIAADSLRTDGSATIFTVYETDADDTVGLWQVGSGSNRVLWLNSRRASYDDIAVTYRNSNEHGVIIHSMQYQYPALDSLYGGRDTLFIGREGRTVGDKNFCALLYYPGRLDHQYQCQLESALAIRYGALLHGPYINSLSDTLWDPLGGDSLFSAGICGVGRDDSLSLLQPRSIIRNGIMTLEAATPLTDLEHLILGRDGGSPDLSGTIIFDDTDSYLAVERRWKLRAHTYGHATTVRLTVGLPFPADALRLMHTTADGAAIVAPDTTGAFTLAIADGQDYYLTLLVKPSALLSNAKGGSGTCSHDEPTPSSGIHAPADAGDPTFSVAPNPTSGHYTVRVTQPDDAIINIRVVDANGRIVEQHSTTEPHSHYTYSGHLAPAGIYYVTVSSNGRQQTIKLIVVR